MKNGEYVRTKSGYIYKLSYYDKKYDRWISSTKEDWYPIYPSEIISSNEDITKLIKLGDIIEWEGLNDRGVNEVINYFGAIGVYGIQTASFIPLEYLKINKVLCKEQFEVNCYNENDN